MAVQGDRSEKHQQQMEVLILDDEEVWRNILTEIVDDAGFKPILVNTLGSARTMLQNRKFDIVVTDVFLQGARQGFWLLEDVLKIHQELKEGPLVIVVSGSDRIGLKETHTISFDYRNIVIAFLSKEHFNDGQMKAALKEAAKKKHEAVAENKSIQGEGTSVKQQGSDQSYLKKLHQFLLRHFDEEELKTLCLNLGVDYDGLPSTGKTGKARELVLYLERHGRITELKNEVIRQRPRVSWRDMF